MSFDVTQPHKSTIVEYSGWGLPGRAIDRHALMAGGTTRHSAAPALARPNPPQVYC